METLFGEIDYYFDNKIDAIEAKSHQIIDLDFEPTSFYTLPNGHLVIAGYYSQVLKIYDSEFNLVKTIDKINNKTFRPLYLTSNGKKSIYITDCSAHQIIQTDLDFNFIKQFGSKGSSNQQLYYPLGIEYYEDSVYVCDSNNQRIQKLSEDLVYQETYPLNFHPWNIKIIKNIACVSVRASWDPTTCISLYQLNPFSFKTKN